MSKMIFIMILKTIKEAVFIMQQKRSVTIIRINDYTSERYQQILLPTIIDG
jgi:hypothetical protein